jgi:serine/threonine protein phosphatase PrpC
MTDVLVTEYDTIQGDLEKIRAMDLNTQVDVNTARTLIEKYFPDPNGDPTIALGLPNTLKLELMRQKSRIEEAQNKLGKPETSNDTKKVGDAALEAKEREARRSAAIVCAEAFSLAIEAEERIALYDQYTNEVLAGKFTTAGPLFKIQGPYGSILQAFIDGDYGTKDGEPDVPSIKSKYPDANDEYISRLYSDREDIHRQVMTKLSHKIRANTNALNEFISSLQGTPDQDTKRRARIERRAGRRGIDTGVQGSKHMQRSSRGSLMRSELNTMVQELKTDTIAVQMTNERAALGHPERCEDATYMSPDGTFYGLWDGIGSAANSDQVVSLAKETISSKFAQYRDDGADRLDALTRSIADYLKELTKFNAGQADEKLRGTTASLLVPIPDQSKAIIFNKGDSRIYRLSADGKLTQVTEDDDLLSKITDLSDDTKARIRRRIGAVNKIERNTTTGVVEYHYSIPSSDDSDAENGILTMEELTYYQRRNTITDGLLSKFNNGAETMQNDTTQLDKAMRTIDMQPGDRFLLCSDGLYEMLRMEEIQAILKAPGYTETERMHILVHIAQAAAGLDPTRKRDDDISVVLTPAFIPVETQTKQAMAPVIEPQASIVPAEPEPAAPVEVSPLDMSAHDAEFTRILTCPPSKVNLAALLMIQAQLRAVPPDQAASALLTQLDALLAADYREEKDDEGNGTELFPQSLWKALANRLKVGIQLPDGFSKELVQKYITIRNDLDEIAKLCEQPTTKERLGSAKQIIDKYYNDGKYIPSNVTDLPDKLGDEIKAANKTILSELLKLEKESTEAQKAYKTKNEKILALKRYEFTEHTGDVIRMMLAS